MLTRIRFLPLTVTGVRTVRGVAGGTTPAGESRGAAAVVTSSTRLSWSSSSASATSLFLASVCTVLIGTSTPALLGLMSPSSVANAIARPTEASSRNRATGSPKATRRTLWANAPRFASTGLRRFAKPERTAARPSAGRPLAPPMPARRPFPEGRAGGGGAGLSGRGSSVMAKWRKDPGGRGRGQRSTQDDGEPPRYRRSTGADGKSNPLSQKQNIEATTPAGLHQTFSN